MKAERLPRKQRVATVRLFDPDERTWQVYEAGGKTAVAGKVTVMDGARLDGGEVENLHRVLLCFCRSCCGRKATLEKHL